MRSLLQRFMGAPTPSEVGRAPTARPSRETVQPKEEMGHMFLLEPTADIQKKGTHGEVTLGPNNISYVLRGLPSKVRGEDSVLVSEKTGLTGVADGVSGSNVYGKDAPADASLNALYQLPNAFSAIMEKAEKNSPLAFRNILLLEQKKIEASYGIGNNGTFAEQLTRVQTEVTPKTMDTVLRTLMALSRAIERVDQTLSTKGMTTLSVGKILPLENGKQLAVFAVVGDSYVLLESKEGTMTHLVPPQTWAHHLKNNPATGPQEPLLRTKFAKRPTNMVGMDRKKRGNTSNILSPIDLEVTIGVRILEEYESIIYASDGIDALGDTAQAAVSAALSQDFDRQDDDVSIIRVSTPLPETQVAQAA